MQYKYNNLKNFYKNKNILVTGHTGFKGSWLSLWLNRLKAEVYGISLKPDSENCLFIPTVTYNMRTYIKKSDPNLIDLMVSELLSIFVKSKKKLDGS